MGLMEEKRFAISCIVSCKNMMCRAEADRCRSCLERVVGESVRKFDDFKASTMTTGHGSKQFGVSFVAACRKPDCSAALARGVACCTANADKCEQCLTTVVGKSIRELAGLHVKEIVIA
jgi:hypothetical protein